MTKQPGGNAFPAAGLLAALILGASPAFADGNTPAIVRHPTTPPGIILQAVTIPPGAETLVISGQVPVPLVPGVNNSFEAFGDTKVQSEGVFRRIEAILIQRGWTMADVVKLQVFLVGDPKLEGRMDFAGFNAAYRQFFGTTANPNLVARTTMQIAGLANPYFLVEIEATAARMPSGAAAAAR